MRFLHVSTDEVYGDIAGNVHHSLDEDPSQACSPHALTKAAANYLLMSYRISFALNTVITRGSTTYHPRQFLEKIISLPMVNAPRIIC